MKTYPLTILAILFCISLMAQDTPFKGSEFCAHGKQMRPDIDISAFRSPNSPKHSFDVLNYEIDIDIYHCYTSPYPKSFTATSIVTFKVDSALSQIKLNAVNSSLQINSVGLSGVSFTHLQDTLTIVLNEMYQPGDTVDVSIEYSHLNVSDEAFYADYGFVFTDCEPQGARKWFPCYDHPSDKATLSLKAKVPANVKLGSNGRLADSLTIADTTWYTWVSRDPIATYLMVITSRANYNLDIVNWQKPGSDEVLPIRFYYNPGENPTAMKQMIVPLANYFYSIFGDHPFEKDGFATLSPQFSWGGMENQSLTSLCPNCWNAGYITHEFAHQWFGDMITCATWADLWLNEGFATFSEALWAGEVNGPQAYKNDMNSNASYYLGQNPGWAISNPAWAFNPPSNNVLFNYAITYMKASCILHMYRYLVGDEVFFNSIHQYATDTVNFRYKTATIGDFADKVSEVAGQDLHWFFDQWLLQPNHPMYDNTYSFKDMGEGNWNVNFLASQIQTNAPFFKMPLELKITFEGGTDTLVRLMNNMNDEFFAIEFNKRPLSLIFDPDNNILLKQASTVVSNNDLPLTSEINFVIEPNPAKESVELKFRLESAGNVSLSIFDMKGGEILKTQFGQLSQGQHNQQIDVRNFSEGTYIVYLRSDSGNPTGKKLVIIR